MVENKKIEINYTNSGVNFLRVLSVIFILLGIILSVGCCVLIVNGEQVSFVDGEIVTSFPWAYLMIGMLSAITLFFMSGIAKAVSTIAENALIQKKIAEEKYILTDNTININRDGGTEILGRKIIDVNGFHVGETVVVRKTGEQMKIDECNVDGTYFCSNDGSDVGCFSAEDLMSFEEYTVYQNIKK